MSFYDALALVLTYLGVDDPTIYAKLGYDPKNKED